MIKLDDIAKHLPKNVRVLDSTEKFKHPVFMLQFIDAPFFVDDKKRLVATQILIFRNEELEKLGDSERDVLITERVKFAYNNAIKKFGLAYKPI